MWGDDEGRRPDELPPLGTGGGIMSGAEPGGGAMQPGTGSLIDDTFPLGESAEAREDAEREGEDRTARPDQEGWTGDSGAKDGDDEVRTAKGAGDGSGI